ncbi:RRN11 RNA polymerase I-specific transcription initiation factor RRN11 [Candida maltosa Xu316]
MFEDITFYNTKHARASRTSQHLLNKYQEIRHFTDIYKTAEKPLKKKLRRKREKVLKLIHDELNKRLKPEETYEVWHDLSDNLNKNINKKVNGSGEDRQSILLEKVNTILRNEDINEEEEEEGDAVEEGNDEKYETYNIISTNKLTQFVNDFDTLTGLAKYRFIIESNGFEVLPIEKNPHEPKSSFHQHITNLTSLLHLQIMRQNWSSAYKIFSILLRFPQVDLRTIWPLGIEILLNMNELENGNNVWSLKVKKFFNYLASFYTISKTSSAQNTVRNNRSNTAPVWRSGTRTLTPMYIITSLWYLFVNQDYEQVLNRVNELIIEPPYNLEGVLYFIVKLDFLFPKTEIEAQFHELVEMVRNPISKNGSSSSDDEMIEQNESVHEEVEDTPWDMISSDSINEDEEEAKENLQIIVEPTQLDEFEESDFEEAENFEIENAMNGHEVSESIKQVDRTMDDIEFDKDTTVEDFEEIPASQSLEYIVLPDTQLVEYNELPDTQPIENYESDHEISYEKILNSFDTRRNSLELYNTRGPRFDQDFSQENPVNGADSQQTMLDFDFDFDSD